MSITITTAKDRSKWNQCLNCNILRYIVSRGLCMGCWREPTIRERYKDKRVVPTHPLVPLEHEILNNVKQTEPTKLFFLAHRKMRRWGERIQIDDLMQIGWLMMIKGVKEYQPKWSEHTTLFKYCRMGISSEMERHCLLEIRSSTMGVSHEDFIDFIDNDNINNQLKGGLSRYTTGQYFNITNHALQRYRERFNPSGTRKELGKIVECSIRLPREKEDIWLSKENYNSSLHEVREYGKKLLLVMGPALQLYSKLQQVITVIDRSVV